MYDHGLTKNKKIIKGQGHKDIQRIEYKTSTRKFFKSPKYRAL